MPDPRQPQRPQQRQPVSQPQRGQSATDPNAARRGSPRPIRQLDPSQQAPPIESARKLRKGEVYWIMGHEEVPSPRKGRIIRLSNEIGRQIGVEFVEPIGGIDNEGQLWGVYHTCNGSGKVGHCLYVLAEQVLDEKAMQIHKARSAEQQKNTPTFEEYEEITVGPQTSQRPVPATSEPATPAGERMTIGSGDVGQISAEDLFKSKTPDEVKAKDKDEEEAEEEDEDK